MKWLDNFDGLTDKGFNYNGAWGGPAQNGEKIKKAYNPSLAKRKDFQDWYNKNTLEGQNNIPYSDKQSYDYLSFFMNKEHKNKEFNIEKHFPDTYKRPNHPTFSDESIYSIPENPGGHWDGETYIPEVKHFAMGGNMPGSIGFSYVREGAPSEGKYAKKTLPSAEDGTHMEKLKKHNPELYKKVQRNNRAHETKAKWTEHFEKEKKKKEAKEWVGKSMEEAYKHPLMSPGYFTPEGALIGSMQAGVHSIKEATEGNYGKAAFNAGMALLPLLPQAYKINPWAKKGFNDPNMSYRVAGLDSYDDFVNSGVVRSKAPVVSPKGSVSMERPTSFPSFQKGYADLRYLPEEGGVIYETGVPTFKRGEVNPVTQEVIRGRHYAHRPIDMTTGNVITELPANDVRVFGDKPHWLKGYQEINKVSEEGKGFGPLNQSLLPQSTNSGIEERIKNLHSSMPEMMQSLEGRKRLQNLGIDPDKLEYPTLRFTEGRVNTGYFSGSNNLDINLDELNMANNLGIMVNPESAYHHEFGHFLTRESDRLSKISAGINPENIHPRMKTTPIDELLTEAYTDVNSPHPFYAKEDAFLKTNQNSFDKSIKEEIFPYFLDPGSNQEAFAHLREMRQHMIDKGFIKDHYSPISADVLKRFIQENPSDRISSFTPVDNPDIMMKLSQALRMAPAVIPVAGAASMLENKKNGGVVKDNMGYWNPDNWGKTVEIGSPHITMVGVREPLLGVSDTGDTKLMQPGKEYKFKGSKVRESRIAKNGSQLIKLDQLTNFTNYNTPQPGGWLDNL